MILLQTTIKLYDRYPRIFIWDNGIICIARVPLLELHVMMSTDARTACDLFGFLLRIGAHYLPRIFIEFRKFTESAPWINDPELLLRGHAAKPNTARPRTKRNVRKMMANGVIHLHGVQIPFFFDGQSPPLIPSPEGISNATAPLMGGRRKAPPAPSCL
jgi:hypothetical protein